jgi:hypothetical protein
MYALSENPANTRNLEREPMTIGNATHFAAWMIKNANDPTITDENRSILYANWNLDSDRGYGYLSWSGTIKGTRPYEVENETYL